MIADTLFEAARGHLRRVAYRMLGTVSDAEDVVQEAYLRWRGVDASSIADARAFLTRITTRLCLDHLKSARAAALYLVRNPDKLRHLEPLPSSV